METPIDAVRYGLCRETRETISAFQKEFAADPPSKGQLEDAFNIAIGTVEDYESFLNEIGLALRDHLHRYDQSAAFGLTP